MIMRIISILLLILGVAMGQAKAAESAAAEPVPHYGVALRGEPKYAPDFQHLDYVDPDAPKGGELRLGAQGTFDTVNPFILKGVTAVGSALPFDSLMDATADEPFSQYGLVAKTVTIAPDRSWVSYELRPEARFHDGHPITADDVIFSFTMLKEIGHPQYRSYYKDVVSAKKLDDHNVKFTFKDGGNTELPLIMGHLPVLPKHFWEGKNFAMTTVQPILGSGPYKIASIDPGHRIVYERVKDWWAKDLPINRGRYNFDRISYDYYRDSTVELEALFAGRYDLRTENTAKYWATAYTSPAVKSGAIIKQEIPNQLPSGMQGFVLNLRREIFQDVRVREALDLAFDFEWSNKNVAYGAYKRTQSYFANSELASTGLPGREELDILTPYRGKIPDDLFLKEYKEPVTDGSGDNRDNLRRATDLLREAGWVTDTGGFLTDKRGTTFRFTLLDSDTRFERWIQPWLRNLERLGIRVEYRVVDPAQLQNRKDHFDFDVIIDVFPQSLSPGNEQRDYWTSAKADVFGSRNLAGIHSPVVDDLVEKLIRAPDRESLINHCRALDRVLLWGHYVIPHWNTGIHRLAYWDKFGQPKVAPKYGLGFMDTWWIDPAKAKGQAAEPAKAPAP
ncbi:MAG: extracellular solute-binding protein [Alphaproteobacteria bacterium]